MMAQPLRQTASGKTYIDLADDVFEAESEEELLEEYDYVRKPENVGYLRIRPKFYELGEEVLVP